MNKGDILNFNGEKITIEDIFKKPTKTILIGLYVKMQILDGRSKEVSEDIKDIGTKIDNQWKNIGKNNSAISRISGIFCVLIPIILGIIGYIAYTR